MLTGGRLDLFRWQQYGNFYDAQAHSLEHGHLAIDPRVLGIEAFFAHGGAYMYQGPVPALLRLPVVALAGDRFDGRLTVVSMLVALALAAAVLVRLERRIRAVVRGGAPFSRRESVLVAATLAALVAGPPVLFQTSRAWIYHEAVLWGIALTLLAVDQLVRYALAADGRERARALAWCALATTAAVLTRASIGLGPVVALTVLSAWRIVRGGRAALRSSAASVGATVLPIAAYAMVNVAKFGSLFAIPFRSQKQALVDPSRQAFLDANHGSFFGVKFVPTTVAHYLDPIGIRLTRAFPYLEFPRVPGRVIGGVRFDLLDRAAGLPVTAPLLVVLSIVGVYAVARRRELRALRLPLVAALASAVAILPFGYVAQRYIGDATPILALGGLVGVHLWLTRSPSPARRRALDGTFLALGALTVLAGVALALDYQRLWSTNIPPTTTAGFLGLEHDLGAHLAVERGDTLPATRPEGTLFAVDRCAALYLSDGLPVTSVNRSSWNLVEGTASSGSWHLRLRFPTEPIGTAVPIFTSGTADEPNTLVARYVDARHIAFEYHPAHGIEEVARPVRIERGRWYDAALLADWRIDRLSLTVGDVVVLEAFYGERAPGAHLGSNPWATANASTFPGGFVAHSSTAPLCHELVGAS
jgi:hypothetical protein